jgi:hypothetical protein
MSVKSNYVLGQHKIVNEAYGKYRCPFDLVREHGISRRMQSFFNNACAQRHDKEPPVYAL